MSARRGAWFPFPFSSPIVLSVVSHTSFLFNQLERRLKAMWQPGNGNGYGYGDGGIGGASK